MAFYVGGDTTELEYDFYTKTAGSTVDCPMKIYKGEVDPAALPGPTDVLWKEVTSQSVIDKLKEQNEITTSNLATDKSTIKWGDKTLNKTSIIKIVDDFVGKTFNNVSINPNKSCIANSSSLGNNVLLSPSLITAEGSDYTYGQISTLNNSTISITENRNGYIPQHLFSFNLIEIVERKFGTIPKETLVEKIDWLKNNLNEIRCVWTGYGSCPTGNKAYLAHYTITSGTWQYDVKSHTASTPSSLSMRLYRSTIPEWAIHLQNNIDANGFVHFLAYTDASNGTVASTIYTDYVSIELTLKAPENLITATNTLSDIVTDFTDKVSGSTGENANTYKVKSNTTTLSVPSDFTIEPAQGSYDLVKTLNAATSSSTTSGNTYIPQQLFSFNIVSAVEKHLGQPIPAIDKVQWCKDNINMLWLSWYGHGSCPSGNKAILSRWSGSSWTTVSTNTSSSPTILNSNTPISNIQSDGMMHYLTSTDPSDGVTTSAIYTDYIKLTIKLKYIPTYDFYTDSNNRRDAGLTNIVLVKRSIGDMISDFTGKVQGSVVENPNISRHNAGSTTNNTALYTPSSPPPYESSTAGSYYASSLLDNYLSGISVSNNSGIAQQLFSFNLIAIAEKQLGTSIPGADTASKIQWLKDNLNSIKCDWHGFGSCQGGNKAYLTRYHVISNLYNGTVSNTSTSPTNLYIFLYNSDLVYFIDANGFVHFLAYTDASNGTIASVINTDYVKLSLTFKTDTIGYEFFTNNSSEISVTTNNKVSAFLIECDLTPIATALYGGSNSALKSALKNIEANVWAMGSGANVNQLGYGCKYGLYFSNVNIWDNARHSNILSYVAQTSIAGSSYTVTQSNLINANNKFYIIVHSIYKSDGTIPSEVNLDYVNIKVKLTRTPDVIAPIPIELGDTWSMLLKGNSPSWGAETTLNNVKIIFNITDDTWNNRLYVELSTTKRIITTMMVNGVATGSANISLNHKSFETLNFLLQLKNNKLEIHLLSLTGGLQKVISSSVTSKLLGALKLYLGRVHVGNLQADSFLDNLYFFNNKTFTDEEAEVMLRGRNTIVGKETDAHLNELAEMFKNPNLVPLFNDSRWVKNSNAVVSADGKTLTLNATGNWQGSTVFIPILPNNKYSIKVTAPSSSACLRLDEYRNSYPTRINNYRYNTGEIIFTTHERTNILRVVVQNSTTGTFTFSDLELIRLD